jgi:V8-like Glu-specific endopeptidase
MTYLVNDDLFPYSSVCLIQARFGNDWYFGSGVLVGRNDVLTASHMIYQTGYGIADEVIVAPSFDASFWNNTGNYDNQTYRPAYYEYFTEFDPDGDGYIPGSGNGGSGLGGVELDIALLTLDQAAGDTYGWMGIDAAFTSGNVNITGHPGSLNYASSNTSGYTSADALDWAFPIHQFGVSGGNSGGPVWYQGADGPYVVGLVSTGGYAVDVGGHDWLAGAIAGNDHYITGHTPTNATQRDAQNIALLYEAALNRQAEPDGLNYWIDRLEGGTSLHTMADLFMASAEFVASFGNPDMLSDSAFVDLLYDNVLGRDGDAEGFAYWVDSLAAGSGRDRVLIDFALSPENEEGSPYVKTLFEDNAGNWMFA